ncbi:fungal-specific transcription factor domain-containing protein [Leptodontidium sp. MPI-SDFR-AT-0119]|nr:fungal-specific transcription factor domain-containing protein [Leptodontidium sp. MPI-SDFR-AT-0119]
MDNTTINPSMPYQAALLQTASSQHRRRAAEACAACRVSKVRCDVIDQLPCLRCRVESKVCITGEKKRKRTAPKSGMSDLAFAETTFSQVPIFPNFDFSPTSLPADSYCDLGFFNSPLSEPSREQFPATVEQQPDPVPNAGSSQSAVPNLVNWDPPQMEWHSAMPSAGLPKQCKISHLSKDDLSYLSSKGVFHLPPEKVQDELLHKYFIYIHPLLPILDKKTFWTDYQSGLSDISLLLYRAMLLAATSYMSVNSLAECGFTTLTEAQDIHFNRAKLLFDFDMEERKLCRVQASLLLSYWAPALKVNPSRGNIYWLSGAIAIAKELGLHRDGSISRNDTSDGKLLRRVWWGCFIRDIFLAITYRRPTIIRLNDHDVRPLTWEDVMDASEESKKFNLTSERQLAKMFAHLTQIAPLACRVLEVRFSLATRIPTNQSPSSALDSLLDVERTYTELVIWNKSFLAAGDFTFVDSEETIFKALMLHRNLILVLYNSIVIVLNQPRQQDFDPPVAPWSIGVHELLRTAWGRVRQAAHAIIDLVKELVHLGVTKYLPITISASIASAAMIQFMGGHSATLAEELTRDPSLRICFHALDAIQKRYPVVEDVTNLLHTAVQLLKQESGIGQSTGTRTLIQERNLDLTYHENVTSFKHFAELSRVISFFDLSFANNGPVREKDLPVPKESL